MALQQRIITSSAGKIAVRDLQVVPREATTVLKDSASTKRKSYRCVVRLSAPVAVEKLAALSAATKDLEVAQRNPPRVPRRADLIRQKVIHSMDITAVTEGEDGSPSGAPTADLISVELTTSAGTYVKEFMHGDDGRTVPCIAELLGVETASVVSLDVLEVHLDWPEALDASGRPLQQALEVKESASETGDAPDSKRSKTEACVA
jgi:tRNA pseudouridine synthase 10